MSEIKGMDQIFPKKSQEELFRSSFKLWLIAGVVAAFAAGYAFVPAAGVPPQPAPAGAAAAASSVAESKPAARPEAPRRELRPPAAAEAKGAACDCETAELTLAAECPDAGCRRCKASCGIPGN